MDMQTQSEWANQIAAGALSSVTLSAKLNTENQTDFQLLCAESYMKCINLAAFQLLQGMLRARNVNVSDEVAFKAADMAEEAALRIISDTYFKETCHVNN